MASGSSSGKHSHPATEGEGEERDVMEMIAPPLKRFCSSLVRGVRKIAVEGNIGKPRPHITSSSQSLAPALCVSAATGKSTFLRILEESSPSYHVISEPLTRWQSVEGDQVGADPLAQSKDLRTGEQHTVLYLLCVCVCVCVCAGVVLPAVWRQPAGHVLQRPKEMGLHFPGQLGYLHSCCTT